MNEEELAYYQAQQQEYESEHGACPNCGRAAHISDLGQEPDGQVCCVNCYEYYRNNQSTTPLSDNHKEV